ncbi:MAG: hypothetical protein HYV26_01290, partial [Candidatus Hydrogenedentes bacterium]|nr:hypothetical protein [Candidatus Hydrogenedentota bacterium]
PPPPSRQQIEAQVRDLYRYVEQHGGPSWEVFRKSPDFEEEMSRRLEDGLAFQEHTVLGGDWAAFQDSPELMTSLREAEDLVGTNAREAVTWYEGLLRQTTDQHQKAAIEFRIADIYYHILNAGWVPNPAEAKRRFEAIVDRHAPLCPEVIRSHYWLGDINFKEGNFSEAREHYLAVRQAQETVEAAPEQYPPLSRHWAGLLGRNVGQWLRAVDNAEVMAKTGSKPDSEPVDWAVVWRAVAERGTTKYCVSRGGGGNMW